MGYAFVNVTKLESNTGSSASGSVTATAGNALFCPCMAYESGGTAATLSVSGGGTFASDTSTNAFSGAGTDTIGAAILSCPSATGGTNTISVNRSTGTGGCIGFVYEFSGNPSSAIRDASSPAGLTGNSASASTNALTNATAAAVFIALMVDNDGLSASTVTGTGTGWTYPTGGREVNGSTFDVIGTGYKIVSAVAAQTSTWTITSSKWGCLIAVYKAASPGQNPYNPFPSLPLPLLAA